MGWYVTLLLRLFPLLKLVKREVWEESEEGAVKLVC